MVRFLIWRRELAMQLADQFRALGAGMSLTVRGVPSCIRNTHSSHLFTGVTSHPALSSPHKGALRAGHTAGLGRDAGRPSLTGCRWS